MNHARDRRLLLSFMANPLPPIPEPTMTETQIDPNACAHCGGKVSSYPMGCPGCGAPNCCQRCCDEANPPARPEPPKARSIPMHPDLPHLTHLSYYLIGGGQPRGRTELIRKPQGRVMLENAAQVIQAILDSRREKAMQPANA